MDDWVVKLQQFALRVYEDCAYCVTKFIQVTER